MALIFNSVTKFEIQPERTKRRVKRDDLDTLSEVYIGPDGGEDSFIPAIGTKHSLYNLMTLINAETKREPGSVVAVTLNYQGKLDNSGKGSYTSVPTISQSWMEGEVSYQTVYTTDVRVPTGSGSYYTFPQVGLNTYSRRYTGRCCQISYITTVRPTGNPTQIGLSNDFLGFTNIWDTLTAFQPGASFAMQSDPVARIVCSDVKVEDRADGWYRVTETYQSKQIPGPAVKGPVFNQIGVSTRIVDASSPQPQPITAQNQGWLFSKTSALGAALYGGAGLPTSVLGTIQSDTTKQIGIDPAWAPINQATPAATAAAGAIYPDLLAVAGSQVLDY
jgi:hypothetical protein